MTKLTTKLMRSLGFGVGYVVNYDSEPPDPKIPWTPGSRSRWITWTAYLQKCRFVYGSVTVMKETQISAQISETTRELMERHVRRAGVKKGHLIEQALLHHLQALEELPAEYIVHPRLVVSRKTATEMLRRSGAAEPTPALRDLMRDGD